MITKIVEEGFFKAAGEKYKKYFDAKMKAKGVSSPSQLGSDESKKKFFNEVDKGFKAKKE